MARPARIQNAVILAAAREVYRRRGLAGTTKKIAKKAGVAEGTLFERFDNPPKLFLEAMAPSKMEIGKTLDAASNVSQVDQALALVARAVLTYFREIAPLILPIITH